MNALNNTELSDIGLTGFSTLLIGVFVLYVV